MEINERIQKGLFELSDPEYKEFHSRLMPNIPKDNIIGVRIPQLRKFAMAMAKDPEIDGFLENLPHQYYDENNVHAFILEKKKDFDELIRLLSDFLPYVNNWATCDMMRPKVFAKHKKELIPYLYRWMESKDVYAVRFAIGMFMTFYLDEDFDMEYPTRIAQIRSEEYYIRMMVAWYFATALAKQYDRILPFFTTQTMDTWTHNKAIQKARESNRITKEQKDYLNTWKIR